MAKIMDQSLLDCLEGISFIPGKFNSLVMRKRLESKINAEETILLCSEGIQTVNNSGKIFSTHPIQLADLKRRLNLQKKPEDFKAVTLNRIMACFPEVTLDLVHKQGLPIGYQELKMIHPEFPIVATTEVAAAILPCALTEDETCLGLNLILVSILKTSEKTRRDKKWNDMEQHEKGKNALYFLLKSYNSTVLSHEERYKLAFKYGVVGTGGDLSQTWAEAGAAAKEWLNTHYKLNVKQAGFRLHRF